jgi:arylsulfatase A-like enzyme
VVDAFTEHVDLMPSIIDWLGGAVPLQCDGLSLRPWLEGRPDAVAGWRAEAHLGLRRIVA